MDLKQRYVEALSALHKSMLEEYPCENTHVTDFKEAVKVVCDMDIQKPPAKRAKLGPVRGYIDGCFDIMHSGHYNAIRQAKALCDVLVVGVHSDAEILKHKGPCVMNEEERMALVRGCKWADEVVFDTPYEPSIQLLDELKCDFGVHGDDISTTADGKDAYSTLREAGRLRIIQRTTGVSTTDLVGRLLLMTKDHHTAAQDPVLPTSAPAASAAAPSSVPSAPASPKNTGHKNQTIPTEVSVKSISSFLPTTWRISAFSNNKIPTVHDKVVYVDGAYDLFHVGHIEFLEQAKALGTFLIVGVHSDEVVNKMKGQNYPIMSLHERVLNVLSTKWVDEVVIGAPWAVTEDLVKSLNIQVVAQGTMTKMNDFEAEEVGAGSDPFGTPKRLGIYTTIQSPRSLMTVNVVERIILNRMNYIKRNEVRSVKEAKYLQSKVFVGEISN